MTDASNHIAPVWPSIRVLHPKGFKRLDIHLAPIWRRIRSLFSDAFTAKFAMKSSIGTFGTKSHDKREKSSAKVPPNLRDFFTTDGDRNAR